MKADQIQVHYVATMLTTPTAVFVVGAIVFALYRLLFRESRTPPPKGAKELPGPKGE